MAALRDSLLVDESVAFLAEMLAVMLAEMLAAEWGVQMANY